MRKKSGYPTELEQEKGTATEDLTEKKKVRVGMGLYLASVLLVALAVFILMLVQYLPGHRQSYKLSQVIKRSNVELTVSIPMAEVEKREINPFTRRKRDELSKLLKDMGASSAVVTIVPEEEKTSR